MRILLATTRPLVPAWRGNQLRTRQIAEWLSDEHEVTVLAPGKERDGARDQAPLDAGRRKGFVVRHYRRHLIEAVGGLVATALGPSREPLQSGWYRARGLERSLAELEPESDVVIAQLARLEPALRGVRAPLFVDFVDSLSLNFERRGDVESPRRRAFFHAEARRLAAAERRLLERARGAWIVCERDRRHLLEGGDGSAAAAEKLSILPIGVDLSTEPTAPSSPPIVALTGNLGYFPTVEGAKWFLDQVWPALRARRDGLRCVLAGSRPSRALRRSSEAAGAEVVAEPRDLGAILRSATLAVAPLRAGSGIPIKILEAWAAGVPVVATPWAAAGTRGAAESDFLVAGEPADWIAAIERLLDDPPLRARLAAAGRARLLAEYRSADLRRRAVGTLAAALTLRAR